MKSTHTRIPDAFGKGTQVIEHVSLDALIEAWDEAFERAGVDPTTTAAIAALRQLLDRAGVVTLATWGGVYKAEHARMDLARALAAFGVGAEPEAPIRDRVLH